MKILCVSDQIDPLVYSSLAKERFASVDAILCAGDLTLPEVTDLSNKVLEFDLKFDNVAPGVKVELQDASGKSGFSGFASTYGTDEKGKTASESSYLNYINITQNPSSEWHHVLIDLKNYEGENSSILKGTKTIAFNLGTVLFYLRNVSKL